MKLSRRDFIHAGCTVAAASLVPGIVDKAEGFWHGSATIPVFSQRSGMNVDFTTINEYIFIDHFRGSGGNFFLSPFGTGFQSPNPVWNSSILDVNGFCTIQTTQPYGGGFSIPASANFAGPYILPGTGEGTFILESFQGPSDTFTVNSHTGSVTVTGGTGGSITFTVADPSGTGWSINWTYSGVGASLGPFYESLKLQVTSNNPNNNGKYLGYGGNGGPTGNQPKLSLYRAADATDFANGLIFRMPWKVHKAALNPSFIRVMDWVGGNTNPTDDHTTRWEYRTPPNLIGSGANFLASPPYAGATSSANNRYTLASATGMPVSYIQGETVSFRCDTAAVRATLPAFTTATAITAANPGVATVAGHPFVTGDRVLWQAAGGATGMAAALGFVYGIVGATTTNTFEIGIDTTGFTYTSGQAFPGMLPTINVGARGEVPILYTDCESAGLLFNNILGAGNYCSLQYDKFLALKTSIAGSPVFGCFTSTPADSQYFGGVPIELGVALVNEINALYTTQGATDLWLNCPYRGMMSVDPDYSAGSNWPINALGVVLNGSTVGGVTYAPLTAKAKVKLELSNETWNATEGDAAGFYFERAGFLRMGATANNWSTFHTLRSTVMIQDIKSAFGNNPRIQYVMGMWMADGALANGLNYQRIWGNQLIAMDAWNQNGPWQGTGSISGTTLTIASTTSGSIQIGQTLFGTGISVGDGFFQTAVIIVSGSGSTWTIGTNLGTIATQAMQAAFPPMMIHHAIAPACYIDSSAAWDTAQLNNCATLWAAGGASQTTAINDYLPGLTTDTVDGTQSTAQLASLITDFNAAMHVFDFAPYNSITAKKWMICYEGGISLQCNVGTASWIGAVTTAQSNFLVGFSNSQQWSTAWINFFNSFAAFSNCACPTIFTPAGSHWGFAMLYSGDTYSGTSEFGKFNQSWADMGTRNNALP